MIFNILATLAIIFTIAFILDSYFNGDDYDRWDF